MNLLKKKLKETHLYIIAACSIAGLILANQFLMQCMLIEARDEGLVINTAGKQRMHSQRIAKLSYKAVEDSRYLKELKEEAEEWNMFHFALQTGNADIGLPANESEEIAQLFNELNPYQQRIYDLVTQVQTPEEVAAILPELSANEEAYLPLMNTIVHKFEEESIAQIVQLETMEIILALASLLILTLEFLFIFRPIFRELKNKSRNFEILNESKDRILAAVAHDIRSPLTAIQGTLEIMRYDLTDLNEEDQEMLDLSLDACKKAERLTKELLDISLLESESFHLKMEPIQLEQYFAGILAQFEKKASDKKIELELNISSDHLEARIDKHNFSRVMENLLTNALKFTNEKGKVEVESYEENDNIMISIRDNGIGIPDRLKGYIFDKFSKARRLGTNGESTTGLGMSIVKLIVEKHFGHIWLESQEGVGTAFHISLPKA